MKAKKNKNVGAIVLVVCGILTVLLMIGCIFFPDQIFGFLAQK